MERITKPVEGQNDGQETEAYKLRVALEAHESSKTISQLSSEHAIHPNLIQDWKRQLLEDRFLVFARNGERKQRKRVARESELHERFWPLKMRLK